LILSSKQTILKVQLKKAVLGGIVPKLIRVGHGKKFAGSVKTRPHRTLGVTKQNEVRLLAKK
jgi:hypothetical protein